MSNKCFVTSFQDVFMDKPDQGTADIIQGHDVPIVDITLAHVRHTQQNLHKLLRTIDDDFAFLLKIGRQIRCSLVNSNNYSKPFCFADLVDYGRISNPKGVDMFTALLLPSTSNSISVHTEDCPDRNVLHTAPRPPSTGPPQIAWCK